MVSWKKRRVAFLVLCLTTISIIYLMASSDKHSSTFPKKGQSEIHSSNILKISNSERHSSSLPKTSNFTWTFSIPSGLTFKDNQQLPFFYKPLLPHPNDIYRERYSITASYSLHLKQDLSKSKMILFFNVPNWITPYYMPFCTLGIQKCPVSACMCSDSPSHLPDADAVIIDGVQLDQPDPPVKYSNQVWIFYGLEPLPNYSKSASFRSKNWVSMFNWTMTYRLDSDVVAPYDVLVRHTIRSKKNFTEIALGKSKAALWVVSDCDTQSRREEYVKKLKEYYPVDIYGLCGPAKERTETDFSTLSKDYRFYLSFENALCDDYVSEKLFNVYSQDVHVIPVVRGRVKYHSLFPEGTYINTADFSSPEKLAEHLRLLERNVTAYAEMLREKDRYINTRDYGKLASPFCDICIKLHNQEIFSNHYHNVAKWLEEGICNTPDDY